MAARQTGAERLAGILLKFPSTFWHSRKVSGPNGRIMLLREQASGPYAY